MNRVAVVGGGWAGLAAAVALAENGQQVSLFEAAHALGGRARRLVLHRGDGLACTLDNGQHILIGAYRDTLGLMQHLGVAPLDVLHAMPLSLRFADGRGLQVPDWARSWRAPLDALAAIATARGWGWGDRLGLLRATLRWRAANFDCPPGASVAALCRGVSARAMEELIEPLCVSALNLPSAQASGRVFLRVLRDALFGQATAGIAPAALLLPRVDLSALLPDAAERWLLERGQSVHTGRRVERIARDGAGWQLQTSDGTEAHFQRVVWATGAPAAARALAAVAPEWARCAEALQHTAITTVYAWAPAARLAAPVLALRDGPAQFVFDRGALSPRDPAMQGVMALVISASEGEREALQAAAIAQAGAQLGIHLLPLQTVTEKRATFACTPGLQRPPAVVAEGLWAAGDHVDGPYPATLEGAVRSGLEAAQRALGKPVRADRGT
ncbi:MAG: FAD-dependent oxidoreductase [Hydrogenophaga sp.]|uniref:hydroxysqualene dehydroxylase HpnE n=1 Tax=Hydrogenophaga sp. TaxID=1904254 RepID=UPI0025810F81|nr:hydroxysqualene dehydroxylase HpnE [Hydrogenophaga sp.]MBL0943402.1 FAD-dependent oxidoreductase [Hydrogenophaga sp.]